MILVNQWFYFISAIDPKICRKIKALRKNDLRPALVNKRTTISEEERTSGRIIELGLDNEIRRSDISWANEQWVFDLIWPYMSQANNEAGWNFDISSAESPQIARYKKGGFYDWHSDGGADCLSTYNKPDNKFLDGNARKLSMSILLNDNFSGGEFQFCTYKEEEPHISTSAFKGIGSIIVFPSFIEHRVTPVTKGTRHSLVAWFVGPPFK